MRFFLSICLFVAIHERHVLSQIIDGTRNVVKNNVELSPIVTVSQGDLRARVLQSRGERKYYAFLGIPYASPPIYNLRFLPPSSPLPWQGVRNATQYETKCVQYNRKRKAVEGSEDCLYLNVFVPEVNLKSTVTTLIETEEEDNVEASEKIPVMVFIHGGNFMTGSAEDFGAKYFMDERVILVTFNYRLGVFGFLNTGVREAQGNVGLKDQVLALRWVNENIERFGGDKNRITIFGENAGAASVHYHLLSPQSKELFTGAISQSGTALCPWAFSRQPKRDARKLGAMVNCPNSDMLELAFCLQGKDALELAEAQGQLSEWNSHPVSPFAPSIETTFDSIDKFLPESPFTMISKKQESEIPWLLGVNEDEGLFEAAAVLINPQLRAELNIDWNRIAPITLYYRDTAIEPDAVSNQIRAFYFGSSNIELQTRRNLSNMYADRFYLHANRNSALLHAGINQGKPVYLYYFTHRNFHSRLNELGVGEKLETTQGDELQYLFNMKGFPEIRTTDRHGNFSVKFVRLWVKFSATGVMDKIWGHKGTKWSPISPAEVKGDTGLRYLQIDDEPEVIEEPFLQRMNFWEALPLREYGGETTMTPYSRYDFNYGHDDGASDYS